MLESLDGWALKHIEQAVREVAQEDPMCFHLHVEQLVLAPVPNEPASSAERYCFVIIKKFGGLGEGGLKRWFCS